MKIAFTSQNFRTITGHAGKTRRFLILCQGKDGKPMELERLDLPKAMSMHEYHGDDHPVYSVDLLVTGGCGQGFIKRMAEHGVQVLVTSEADPYAAAEKIFSGEPLPPAEPHEHDHSETMKINLPGQ